MEISFKNAEILKCDRMQILSNIFIFMLHVVCHYASVIWNHLIKSEGVIRFFHDAHFYHNILFS